MDQPNKSNFSFEPEKIETVDTFEADNTEPVEKKYNFELFGDRSGEPSCTSEPQLPNTQKERAPAKNERVDRRSAQQDRNRGQHPAAHAAGNNKTLPVDVPMADGGQPSQKEVKAQMPASDTAANSANNMPLDSVNMDDDFQLSNGFRIPDPEAVKRSAVNRPSGAQRKPIGEPARTDRRPRDDRRHNVPDEHRDHDRKPLNIREYYHAHKAQVIISSILAVIAIVIFFAVGTRMRIDIFGITNTMLIASLLSIAVVLIIVGIFIKQKHRAIYSVMWVMIILIFAGSFAGVVLSGVCDFFGISRVHTISDFSIPEDGNWGTATIAEHLYDEGVINHPTLFRVISRLKHYDGTYQWGNYELNSEMDYATIMEVLKSGNQAATVKVRIPEAATVDEIIKILSDNGVCTKEQFMEAMKNGDYKYTWVSSIPTNTVRYRFEGYLYPDTYNFYAEPSVKNAERAIDKMLSAFNAHLPENWQEMLKVVGNRLGDNDFSLNDALAVGSILELEASGNGDEMKNIASVFYNRLTWNEPHYLGSTPTYYYPDNRYNTNAGPMTVIDDEGKKTTYQAGFEGLPPGPQCSVSETAILACLQPADNEYTYFVTDSDMKFYYNKSYTAHLNTIAKLKKSGKWA